MTKHQILATVTPSDPRVFTRAGNYERKVAVIFEVPALEASAEHRDLALNMFPGPSTCLLIDILNSQTAVRLRCSPL